MTALFTGSGIERVGILERAVKEIEASMAVPGFYDDREASAAAIDRHQALMWEVGDLMHQWEELQIAVDKEDAET